MFQKIVVEPQLLLPAVAFLARFYTNAMCARLCVCMCVHPSVAVGTLSELYSVSPLSLISAQSDVRGRKRVH